MKQINKSCYVKSLKHDFLKEGIVVATLAICGLLLYGVYVYGDSIGSWLNLGVSSVLQVIGGLFVIPASIAPFIAWGTLLVLCAVINVVAFHESTIDPKQVEVLALTIGSFVFTIGAIFVFIVVCSMLGVNPHTIITNDELLYVWFGNAAITAIGSPFARAYGLCKESVEVA